MNTANTPSIATLNNLCAAMAKQHAAAVDTLTEQQLAEAIRQAIESGDFTRYVTTDNRLSVVYLPFQETGRIRALYEELIMAVESKHDGESRHETTLRYIREREVHISEPAKCS